MKFNTGTKKWCQTNFQNLTYCNTQEEYDSVHHHLQAMAPESIMEYYNKSWHGMYTMNGLWVWHLILGILWIKPITGWRFLIEKRFIVLYCVRLERAKNAIKLVQKQPTQKN